MTWYKTHPLFLKLITIICTHWNNKTDNFIQMSTAVNKKSLLKTVHRD